MASKKDFLDELGVHSKTLNEWMQEIKQEIAHRTEEIKIMQKDRNNELNNVTQELLPNLNFVKLEKFGLILADHKDVEQYFYATLFRRFPYQAVTCQRVLVHVSVALKILIGYIVAVMHPRILITCEIIIRCSVR